MSWSTGGRTHASSCVLHNMIIKLHMTMSTILWGMDGDMLCVTENSTRREKRRHKKMCLLNVPLDLFLTRKKGERNWMNSATSVCILPAIHLGIAWFSPYFTFLFSLFLDWIFVIYFLWYFLLLIRRNGLIWKCLLFESRYNFLGIFSGERKDENDVTFPFTLLASSPDVHIWCSIWMLCLFGIVWMHTARYDLL